MAVRYPEILEIRRRVPVTWSIRDTKLYAMGIGAGEDPLDRKELAFVSSKGLKALPTMAALLCAAASPVSQTGINFALTVHAEQFVRLLRPLPVEGRAVAEGQVSAVYDKGEGKGALLLSRMILIDETTGETLAISESTVFARGDGGCGGSEGGVPVPAAMPNGQPDVSLDFATRPGQALLYQLSGDDNPLHSDPDVAARAGFERPILHGLCTYGITSRAIIKALADQDPARVISHRGRFSAPVLPGDVVTVDMWRGNGEVLFEARVKARGITVIKNGRAELREARSVQAALLE